MRWTPLAPKKDGDKHEKHRAEGVDRVRLRTRKGENTEVRSPLERPEVFAGALRDPNESGSLSVTLSVWSDQIVMHNDDVELGEWPRHRVRIIPMDSTTFEFIAEGDRLLFIPDDRVAFAAITTETARAPTPSKAERKAKAKAQKAERKAKAKAQKAERASSATKPAKTKERRASTKSAKPAKTRTKKTKKTKKTKRQRKGAVDSAPSERTSPTAASASDATSAQAASVAVPAAEAAPPARKRRMRIVRKASNAPSAPTSRAESSSVRPLEQPSESAQPESEQKSKRRPSIPRRRKTNAATAEQKAKTAPSQPNGPATVKTKRWIGVIDLVRTHSISGLDRVPVDVSLRGSEHQHTWDHRAAAPSGPSKHICTICGKLRF